MSKHYTIHFPENYVKPKLHFGQVWVTALRSGEHKQGYNALLDGQGGKCCLGVLSSIQGRLHTPNGDFGGFLAENNPVCELGTFTPSGFLPDSVSVTTSHHKGAIYTKLSILNDSGLFTFHDIADIIEETWELL